MMASDRARFVAASSRGVRVVDIARRLIAIPSPNPPGDTRAVARTAATILREVIPNIELALHTASDQVINLVARVYGVQPGRRLVLNGHLDTYPVDENLSWSTDPFGGAIHDNRLYGRGAADMKGGIAASICALAMLAEHRHLWRGEAVLTLAGDEENMGVLGTQWLIDNIPHAKGDAVIIGDAGSPQVVRFGEKGLVWVEVEAVGAAAHGAHVHLGVNAIDRLRAALDAVASLRELPVAAPAVVTRSIVSAKSVSEPMSGLGEADVLARVTVNIGQMNGGTSMNLIPARAHAGVDIRLPVGVAAIEVEAALASALDPIDGVSWRVLRRFEPTYTDPEADIVRCTVAAAGEVLGRAPVVNMRVGGSDARLCRLADMPTIVYGPTPFNMGSTDEYVLLDDLDIVARVHALASLNFLSS